MTPRCDSCGRFMGQMHQRFNAEVYNSTAEDARVIGQVCLKGCATDLYGKKGMRTVGAQWISALRGKSEYRGWFPQTMTAQDIC